MIEVWINANPWEKELVTVALESGADAVIVQSDKIKLVRELGRIKAVPCDGDKRWDRDIIRAQIKSARDVENIIRLSRNKRIVIEKNDWNIVPLENLVSRINNIFVEVDVLEDAKIAAGVLEKGVDGLIITNRDANKIRDIVNQVKYGGHKIELVTLKIEHIRPVGMGDRVCVDTCTLMRPGDGILVGNSSQALFLVHSECLENPYVATRPFRVNAGAVHAYVLIPEYKTRYLSEFRAGDEILRCNSAGRVWPTVVGRVKTERRPLLLVEAKAQERMASIILQNAETTRLVKPGGEAVSVVDIKGGDEVLGYLEEGGRHFGQSIKETITEN
jgi:3-dehydroquinate synthase II